MEMKFNFRLTCFDKEGIQALMEYNAWIIRVNMTLVEIATDRDLISVWKFTYKNLTADVTRKNIERVTTKILR